MLCAVQQQQLHDYDEACLHDTLAKTILVSQTIRRSMWMDVQLSCQTQDNEEESVSDSCHIVLKQGIQYGVVVAFEILYWHEWLVCIPLVEEEEEATVQAVKEGLEILQQQRAWFPTQMTKWHVAMEVRT